MQTTESVRKACEYIASHADQRLTLSAIAAQVKASPYHFQRQFTRVVGLSPRAYQDALRAGHFRGRLRAGMPVAGALYEAGYGSTSRVYERRPTGHGITPAAYRRGGAGMTIAYAVVASPLGRLLVAGTSRGVCAVKLGEADDALVRDLGREFPAASIERDRSALADWVAAILGHLAGRQPHLDLPLDVRATAFQWKVWQCLQDIPYGETRSYGEVAGQLGMPRAVRAVARACATNPVCLVIPCHRVVQKDGSLAGYRWGIERKQALLARETASPAARRATRAGKRGK